jgi:hypothetical protein
MGGRNRGKIATVGRIRKNLLFSFADSGRNGGGRDGIGALSFMVSTGKLLVAKPPTELLTLN